MSATPAKILVVDDDPGMLETLSDVLVSTGYEARVATSGRSAIAQVQAHRFDVILMDVLMPGFNGVQTLHAVRALDPDVPVIMMTAYTRDELVADSVRTTGFGVLSKPLDLDQVLPFLDQVACARPSRSSN
jgi:two-component system, NtrC family, response regulator HydG